MNKPHAVVQKPAAIAPAPLHPPHPLGDQAAAALARVLNPALADVFALFLKTKNFHWHMSGPHFRDYHLLLDEQAAQIFLMTDAIAERVRKLGALTLHSIGEISRLQRLADNNADYVAPADMLQELGRDNRELAVHLRAAHAECDRSGDVATASLIEGWLDETERRAWFLFEAAQQG